MKRAITTHTAWKMAGGAFYNWAFAQGAAAGAAGSNVYSAYSGNWADFLSNTWQTANENMAYAQARFEAQFK